MLKKFIPLFTLVIVGCATNPADEKVEALNTLEFQPATLAPALNDNPEELKSLHTTNKQAIASLTTEIKAARVDNLRSDDVFDNRYGINNVFQALTRLEHFDELNNIYLKENNKQGLVLIGKALTPLSRKTPELTRI